LIPNTPTPNGPFCGDGTVQPQFNEKCDPGSGLTPVDAVGCDKDCTVASCGDGHVNAAAGEQCEDGNTNNGDGCENDCTITVPRCGDGNTDAPGEACDDGNTSNTDVCTNACTLAACGDGFIREGIETCDDGNNLACGTCSSGCGAATPAAVASGLIFAAAGANLVDDPLNRDTFTVDDGVGTVVTFEFTNGTPATGNIPITFLATDTNNAMASKIVTAINGTGLKITATGVLGIVVLTHQQKTSNGNKTITETVATPNFGVFGMSGGQAGDCVTGNGCSVDDDCASHVCQANNTCQ